MLPPTPERPRPEPHETGDLGQTLYSDTLARLAQSHAELKSRIISLESENKRLQEEANLRSMEERNRLLQVHSILKGEDGGHGSLDLSAPRLRPKTKPFVPTRPKPKPQPRAVTPPPPPAQRMPHWRSAESRPAWQRSERSESPRSRPSRPATSATFQGRSAQADASHASRSPQERSLGRTTPPKPKMGRSTPPPPRAPVARSGADSVSARGTPPVPSCFQASARGQSTLTSSMSVP